MSTPDHFNKTTIKKVFYNYPTIKFACCWWLVKQLTDLGISKNNIWVLELDKKYDFGKYIIEPVSAQHDVPNCGYKIIIKKDNYKIFHISDTSKIDHIEAKDFDWASIEANYETHDELEKKIKEADEKGEFTYLRRVIYTHLSQLDAYNWLEKNNIKNYRFIHEHKEKEN